ncbi:MAG: hypothetical protein WBD75_12970 [Phycisphaerae bacterium]
MADFDNVLVFLALGALGLAAAWGLGVRLLVAGLYKRRRFFAAAGLALVCFAVVGTLGLVLLMFG